MPFSMRCCSYLEFPLLYLKSVRCSRYLVQKDLPVCPTYCLLQSKHINWYIPQLSNLSEVEVVVWVKSFCIVLVVL